MLDSVKIESTSSRIKKISWHNDPLHLFRIQEDDLSRHSKHIMLVILRVPSDNSGPIKKFKYLQSIKQISLPRYIRVVEKWRIEAFVSGEFGWSLLPCSPSRHQYWSIHRLVLNLTRLIFSNCFSKLCTSSSTTKTGTIPLPAWWTNEDYAVALPSRLLHLGCYSREHKP